MRALPVALLLCALATPALAQQDTTAAPEDTVTSESAAAAADTAMADTTAADTVAADTTAAAPAADVPHVAPSLDGYVKVAILYRDMLPGAPGDETAVEIFRNPDRAQVLRFVTGGTPWAVVVRPSADAESFTLRDHDCSGGFTEELEAGTPLAVPDCAAPATTAAPATPDD